MIRYLKTRPIYLWIYLFLLFLSVWLGFTRVQACLLSVWCSYCDVGVGEVCPAEQIHQPVEAGQFTARQLLAFHHGGGFHAVQVIDGRDRAQTYTVTGKWKSCLTDWSIFTYGNQLGVIFIYTIHLNDLIHVVFCG